jgi:1A family penicillin-binding protein
MNPPSESYAGSARLPLWLILALLFVPTAALVVASVWAGQHALAIERLSGGSGDTVFLDAAGNAWFNLDEQRRDVPFNEISTYFKDAIIAVEDHRYFQHPGVDPIALTRATLNNLRPGQGTQGGSTLTQQLARTLFLSNSRTYGRKAREAVLAGLLELQLSKREILQLYMNRVYLGPGIYGIETMSQALLGKPAAQLTLGEAALLAGVIRAPARYSPWRHPEAARERRLVVLRRMREEGKITAAQEAEAGMEPLRIAPRPAIASVEHGYAKAYLRQQFRSMFGDDNPSGWTVETTLVPEIQDAATRAVARGLQRLGEDDLQAALVAIDPQTGNVLALVGGSDFQRTPFNRALWARRQPGSAFKPFVFAAAIDRGLSPVSSISGLRNLLVSTPDGVWSPRSAGAHGEDTLTLRDALVESNNAAAVLLQRQIGSAPVLRLAADLGVDHQPDVPSLALGSGLVTPIDLTAAYAVFPALGERVRPRGLVSIRNAAGNRVGMVHIDKSRVMSSEAAFQMVTILQDVIARGTGAPARELGVRGDVGGKTGTTTDAVDAWFVGFNSAVVAGVWVGYDTPRSIDSRASGANTALPIWTEFMRLTAERLPAESVTPPTGLEAVTLCRLSHQRAGDDCPGYTEHFKQGDERPTEYCPIHPRQTAHEDSAPSPLLSHTSR